MVELRKTKTTIRKIINKIKPKGPLFVGRYNSKEEALSHARGETNYESGQRLNDLKEPGPVDKHRLDGARSVIQGCNPISVLDIGGGTIYASLRLHFNLEYTLVELPVCAKLMQDRFPEINVLSEIPESGDFDLVMALGAFQYFDEPYLAFANALSSSTRLVYLSDTLTGPSGFWSKQTNFNNKEVPVCVLDQGAMKQIARALGYQVQGEAHLFVQPGIFFSEMLFERLPV
jgi:putative methyltransferase (TIGR04325 family)